MIEPILEQIIEYFKNLSLIYHGNDMALMALSSKIEGFVRDQIFLQYLNKKSDILPLKEFQRIDLALIEKDKLQSIIEFKSGYSFDLLNENFIEPIAIKWIKNDFNNKKNVQLINENPDINQINILIIVDVKKNSNNEKVQKEYIKYYSQIEKFEKIRTKYDVFSDCNIILNDNFDKENYKIESNLLFKGNALNCEVETYYFIISKNNGLIR